GVRAPPSTRPTTHAIRAGRGLETPRNRSASGAAARVPAYTTAPGGLGALTIFGIQLACWKALNPELRRWARAWSHSSGGGRCSNAEYRTRLPAGNTA